jgi:hypothetical protein
MTRAEKLGITDFPYLEFDNKGNQTYYETSDGWWYKREFDKNGNETYYEGSDGKWIKREYDEDSILIQYEDYIGNYWKKYMCDKCPFIYENRTI